MKKATGAVSCVALLLGAASFASAAGTSAKAKVVSFRAGLSVGQELSHPRQTKSLTSGKFTATLNGSTLKWNLWYRQLSTIPAKAYIHSGTRGVNGPMLVVLCKNCSATTAYDSAKTTGSGRGTVVLTKPQIDAIVAGKAYVNVVTPLNPKGEIRGQIGLPG
jgi:hypothetical protein